MKLGLALGSGGVRGFAHLGVLEVLEREGLTPDFIAGSSAGAAMAAMYAFRPKVQPNITHVRGYLESSLYKDTRLNYLRQREEDKQTLYDKFRVRLAKGSILASSLTKPSLFDEDTLRSNVDFLIPPLNIEESLIPFSAVCFDLNSGEEVVLNSGPVIEGLMASCAIPGVFPPITLGERQLMDGGIVNPVPCSVVRKMGADIVIAVDLSPVISPLPGVTGSFEIAMRAADISRHHLRRLQLKTADVIVAPDTSEVFWADFTSFENCVELGRQATEAVLPKIRALLDSKPA